MARGAQIQPQIEEKRKRNPAITTRADLERAGISAGTSPKDEKAALETPIEEILAMPVTQRRVDLIMLACQLGRKVAVHTADGGTISYPRMLEVRSGKNLRVRTIAQTIISGNEYPMEIAMEALEILNYQTAFCERAAAVFAQAGKAVLMPQFNNFGVKSFDMPNAAHCYFLPIPMGEFDAGENFLGIMAAGD